MRLCRITIKNFRRIGTADIIFEPASFLIGQNNHGKSSVIRAVELLLSGESPVPQDFRFDGDQYASEMEITGYVSGVNAETAQSRGFKGRVSDGQFCYRKTFSYTSPTKPKIECLEYPYTVKPEYSVAVTGQDLVDLGLYPDDVVKVVTGEKELSKRLKKEWEREFLDLAVDIDAKAEPIWKLNPGGIPGVVLSKLPRIVHVPPITETDDIAQADKNTLIAQVLNILFEDLLTGNAIAATLEASLKQLEDQMSPEVDGSLISGLVKDINSIIESVFPGCGIGVQPSLTRGLISVLKPKYEITLFSNVKTGVGHQGTGLLRTAIFSMLRYHAHLRAKREETRPLVVAFEEPELFLHPSAANLLRETIYQLGETDQIVCTTHSPWMVDLSQNLQSLTKMVQANDGTMTAVNYGITQELLRLDEDDRPRVKMLQLFDDEMSRVFFTDRVVVVEGDSEWVAIKQTLKHIPEEERKNLLAGTHVVRARGKASIISLVKYLSALSIYPHVIHDRDAGKTGAEKFNTPIATAVGDPTRVIVLEECLEDTLGYNAPSTEKPYTVYAETSKWTNLSSIPVKWLDGFQKAFNWRPSP